MSSRRCSRAARRLSHCVAFLAVALAVADVSASPNDYVIERIHASACQLENEADRIKVQLVEGDLVFASGQTGTVVLHCPLYTPYQDEDYGQRTLGYPTLWYRDPDGTGTNTHVKADFYYRTPFASTYTAISQYSLSSNSSATTTNTTIAITGNIFVHLMQDAQYEVRIELKRTADNQPVSFRGVTFRDHP